MKQARMSKVRHGIYCPQGELTIYTANRNKEQMLQILGDSHRLEVNLSQVTDMDTAGLQLLILALAETWRRKVPVEFIRPSRSVMEVLELCGMVEVLGDRAVNQFIQELKGVAS